MQKNFMKKLLKQIFGIKVVRVKKTRTKKIDKNYLAKKEAARKIIVPRVEMWAQKYNFEYNKIFIKNQKTRWGSCSSKKNLNFNYRLAFMSVEMMDYVIVHELCHLKEMNHSKNFWNLVESILPDYKRVHNEMKKVRIVR